MLGPFIPWKFFGFFFFDRVDFYKAGFGEELFGGRKRILVIN
jgi:hypothetical protein